MSRLSIGIVGAGRTRNGLGPFLADFAERAGLHVAAIGGRTAERAVQDAAQIAARLGHPVRACRNLDELCTAGIDALVIASPTLNHLEALAAAFATRLPVLCDKPLVQEHHGAAGAAQVEEFAEAGLLCMEHCQWPYVLPDLYNMQCSSGPAPHRVEMGLAPARPGREMVQGMLPHLLSVVQALAPVDERVIARRVVLDPLALDGTPTTLRFALEGPRFAIAMALHLQLGTAAPRPAWIEIDGDRRVRHVGAGFAFAFDGAQGRMPVRDPTQQLVEQFAELVRIPEPARIRNEVDQVRQRLRLYREILRQLA